MRYKYIVLTIVFISSIIICGCSHPQPASTMEKKLPETLLLKNFRPKSIYKIPKQPIAKAKYPVIDIHSHPYASSSEGIEKWVQTMDKMGIEKTIILTCSVGAAFDSIYALYEPYKEHFDVWCGFDYTGYNKPGYGPAAVKELERCAKVGAKGVGELGDKGKGLFYTNLFANDSATKAWGMHINDPRMDPLLEKCAEINLPVNIHIAEPVWFYQKMDSTNDALMNAYNWRQDDKDNDLDHDGLIKSLENALARHPNTTFISCHFANLSYNLTKLGALLDKYPNLWVDISARYAETAAIPRFTKQFYIKYQDRLMYGTDMGCEERMYKITFRILETADEHFYETEQFNYHWYLNGLDLPDGVLEKVYYKNASRFLRQHG